jgi:hypothetical protein
LLQLHPLSVRLEFKAPAQAGSSSSSRLATTLTFYYYTQLKLLGVLASTPEDQELITNLFLGDVGDGALLENIGVCSSSGALDFATAGRPCPFRWGLACEGWHAPGGLGAGHIAVLMNVDCVNWVYGNWVLPARIEAPLLLNSTLECSGPSHP